MSKAGDATPDDKGPLDKDGTFEIMRSDFSDGREKGDYRTRYPRLAWLQIAAEGLYLLIIILLAAFEILVLVSQPQTVIAEVRIFFPSGADAPYGLHVIRLWLTVFFAGMLGGATFSLKWLYHSISWREWNRDRIVWRLSVPIIGGLMAVFTGCMVMSGIIPLLTKELFSRLLSCAGFGFFVGLFADNFLAALQKFAARILGTLGKGT